MKQVEIEALIAAEESDVLERKASLQDVESIVKSILAFANDIAGRDGGVLILGQKPDKAIEGLDCSADEALRRITDMARTKCYPGVYVIASIHRFDVKDIAIVRVPSSYAKPHFRGACYIRQGSTNRQATDAEISAIRGSIANKKLRQIQKWLNAGQRQAICVIRPAGLWGVVVAEIKEVNENYVILQGGTQAWSPSLDKIDLGFDHTSGRPRISFDYE